MSHRVFHVITLVLLAAMLPSLTFAADSARKPSSAGSRQKVIDFEDELVEGMNKRPLDSLSQISEAERRRRRPHLYRKRASFRGETAQTLRELRYAQ